MKLVTLPLTDTEQQAFAARGMSESHQALVRRLEPISFEWLWHQLVPQPLTSTDQIPGGHWSQASVSYGPSYFSYCETADADWESKWTRDAVKFFINVLEFGGDDNILVINSRLAYETAWETFLENLFAFSPWHDVSFVIRRDSEQIAKLVEDYHSIQKVVRPPIPGFDSKAFVKLCIQETDG